MKAEHAERAAILVRALRHFDALTDDAANDEVEGGYDRKGLEIQVAHIDAGGSGSSSNTDIELDLVTARLVLPIVRGIVEQELQAMGVEL